MDEVLNTIAADTGLTLDQARQAVGHILLYIKTEGTDPAVETMIDKTPGANEAIVAAGAPEGGNVLSSFGGGIMALGSKLMGLGLDMGGMRTVGETLIGYARRSAGDETVDRVIQTTPGLAQFA